MIQISILWTCDDSIWTQWMRGRYIKAKGLRSIDFKGKINSIIKCGPNYDFLYRQEHAPLRNVWETLRSRGEEGRLKIQYNDMAWRARWGKIATRLDWADKIRDRDIDTDCVLCNIPMESKNHIFFLCKYSTKV